MIKASLLQALKNSIGMFFFSLIVIAVAMCAPADAADAVETQYARSVMATLAHTNDMHGTARGSDFASPAGLRPEQGILRAASVIRAIREENPNTLALDAGDLLHGTPLVYAFKGEPMIDLLNAAGYDAMTLGNHDFEWGLSALEKHVENARFTFLGANVAFPIGRAFRGVKPYIIREFDGARIAVVGLTTQQTIDYIWPPYLQGTQIASPEETLAALMPELKRNADFIVVLSHLGYDADMLLAQRVQGIDIILGGHTHRAVYPPSTVGATQIFNAGSHGGAVGRIDILFQFDENDKIANIKTRDTLIAVTRETPEAEDLAKLYSKYYDAFTERAREVVAKTLVELDASDVRLRENRMGSQIADIIRDASGAEIAVVDSTLIGAGIPEGDIALITLYSALPAYTRQNVVVGRLSGERLREALEHSVSGFRHPMLLQVSGIEYTLDASAPAGARVSDVSVNGAPLEDNRLYYVATTSHLFMGGTGFAAFLHAIDIVDLKRSLRDIVEDGLRKEYYIWPDFAGRVKIAK